MMPDSGKNIENSLTFYYEQTYTFYSDILPEHLVLFLGPSCALFISSYLHSIRGIFQDLQISQSNVLFQKMYKPLR